MIEQTNNTQPRIFKIGTSTIVEDASFAGMNHEQIRDVLKRSYPKMLTPPSANATDDIRWSA